MGMPVILEVAEEVVSSKDAENVFKFLTYVDEKFSTYKQTSEITKINDGHLKTEDYSPDMQLIFQLARETNQETKGYFDIREIGFCDPSGIVKGWAISEAAKILTKKGYKNFYLEIAGDIQVKGKNFNGEKWRIGVKNPFNTSEIIKILALTDSGIATSGSYERGSHIYNPIDNNRSTAEIASFTVVAPDIYDADRFATAAFAMGEKGISFIEKSVDLEGYMVNNKGIATMTSGLEKYYA